MSRFVLSTIILFGLLLVMAGNSFGQFGYHGDKSEMFPEHLLVDYAFFQGNEPDQYRLEIYFQIHNRGLTFTPGENRFTAEYELIVTVKDDDDDEIERFTRERQVIVGIDDEARTRTDFRTSQINLDLAPGTYKIFCKLKDRTTDRLTIKELKVKTEDFYKRQPKLSSVEFVQAFQDQADTGSVFAKGEVLVIPSVHRTYGNLENDRVAFYYEIYRGSDELDKVVVETKVRHYRKGMLYRDTVHLDLEDSRQRRLQEISLASFLPGLYELEIQIRGRRNKALDRRTEEFKVSWSQEGMLRNDWKAVVRQLELFSEDVDVSHMEKLKGYEACLEAFNQFWRERDPTVGTIENEAKVAFYYRVRIANERFGIMRQDGWRSDRGRVFIRYGEPDQMVEEPFSLDRPPYQIWNYSRFSPNRRFYFIDENNDGDYRLQFPYDGLGYSGGY